MKNTHTPYGALRWTVDVENAHTIERVRGEGELGEHAA
jgi:hypothetical protein